MIELTAVGTLAAKIAPKLAGFFVRRRRLVAELEYDIEHIQRECSIIAAAITDDGNHPHSSDAAEAHQEWIKIVRDLAYDIDDCIDHFIHRVSTAPVADAGWIRRKAHRLKTVRARRMFAAAIVRLRKRSDEASELRKKYTDLAYGHGRVSAVFESRPAPEAEAEAESEAYTDSPVGMEACEQELLDLIREKPQGQPQPERLKVISLVGFGGIGKSQLAKRVYDTLDETQYPARAWVRAGEKGPEDLLQSILQKLGTHTTAISASSSNSKLCATIQKRLGTQRFFIVIDDMREDFWVDIKDSFPLVPGVGSRVLVTTARQTIAMKSSSRDGHVYVMRTLADDHSRQLFCEEASLVYPPTIGDKKLSSEVIKRCDGLPLALVTTARLLHGESRPEQWADLGGNLGEHLENNKKLASMNGVLVRSYTSLSKQHIKTCLLYLGIYPSGRPIRRGSLIRRWSAEGFITAEHKRSAREVAVANFNELVDWSIIQPINASSSRAEVKACQTHGIMLEFLLHKSMCENFVTLLYDDVPPPSKVRWLSLHNGSAASSRINPNDVPFLRSLTIFGKAHKSVLNFSKYKLMRVLDLEECHEHLEDKHLKGICSNLLLLRYLSLRGSSKITVIPKEVKKLQLLETLDVRGTNIEILPMRVMQLPCLIHLFGKFKLPQGVGSRKMRKLQAWLQEEENSKLQAVAGFVVNDRSQGFAQLMGEMKKLMKVKIWCESTTDASSYLSHVSEDIKGFIGRGTDSSVNLCHLSQAIKEFIDRGTDQNKARSLSLNMNGAWSQDLLNFSLENDSSCYLSSLKLQGNNMSSLPSFISMLGGLTKLCLSFSHLQLSSGILQALNNVSGLKYLKLNATRLDGIVFEEDALGSLKRLCIVVEVMSGLVIEKGAFPDLESLQLPCKDLNGFSSTRIQSLTRLKEVALHDGVSKGTKEDWKGATKNHPRHPKLLFVTKQMVDDHFKPMGSEAAPGISPAATLTDTIVVESEPEENSESPTVRPTDTTLLMTTLPDAISTQESVQVVTTSEMVHAQDLMGTKSATESSPVATTTDRTKKIDVESEPAENSESPVAPPTDMMLSMAMPSNVISTGGSVQLNGGYQHDDDGKDLDNIEDSKDFAMTNGLRAQVIDQMSKERYKVEIEGPCLGDLHMKDGTQVLGDESARSMGTCLLKMMKFLQ
ncbi:putative disease resistance RPP13-like protein 3 [Hordeum vulgare]|nr:putative disease resistance RPP13-like protein 3 [Hordeum vulgare]